MFGKQPAKLALLGFIVVGINALMGFVLYMVTYVPFWVMVTIKGGPDMFRPEPDPFSQGAIERNEKMVKILEETFFSPIGATIGVVSLLLALVFSIVYIWLYAGQIMYVLGVVRGKNPSLSLVFKGGKHLWSLIYYYAYVTIIIMLMFVPIFFLTFLPGTMSLVYGSVSGSPDQFYVGLGVLLCFLGSFLLGFSIFYFQLIYGFGSFFIIDSAEPVSPAMRSSRRNVHNNFWRLFLAALAFGLINAFVACLPILGIFTLPFFLLFQSFAYLRMSGRDIESPPVSIPEPGSGITTEFDEKNDKLQEPGA